MPAACSIDSFQKIVKTMIPADKNITMTLDSCYEEEYASRLNTVDWVTMYVCHFYLEFFSEFPMSKYLIDSLTLEHFKVDYWQSFHFSLW